MVHKDYNAALVWRQKQIWFQEGSKEQVQKLVDFFHKVLYSRSSLERAAEAFSSV